MIQEIKIRKLAAEAEEQKLAAEATEREAERKHQLEMKKLQLDRERFTDHGSASSEGQQMASCQASQENAVAKSSASYFCGRNVGWLLASF